MPTIRMTISEALRHGIMKPRPKVKATRGPSMLAALFVAGCREHGLPMPWAEYRFDAKRKWRFDFVWIHPGVALEIQGGIFSHGRHTQGAALLKEYEKLNRAAVLGFRVVFATPQQVESGEVFALLKELLG